jgi:hypothetical protein
MRLFLVIIAFIVLVSGVVYTQSHKNAVSKVEEEKVLSEEYGQDLVGEVENNITPDADTKTLDITQKPTLLPTPTSKVLPENNINIDNFKYPGSETIGSSQKILSLKTMDNPDIVTTWYKDKITSLNMNVRSFVTTKTNDNVLNKLSAAGTDFEVSVEVKRVSGESTTLIQVEII